MVQLKNQNTHKMATRGEKETGAILAGTKKRVPPIEEKIAVLWNKKVDGATATPVDGHKGIVN